MSDDRDKTSELLSAYLDGELTEEQSRTVEKAVSEDPAVALELHELTAARRLLTGLPREKAPRGFVRRVMNRAERKHLLGGRQAGGAFAASRWITMAVAAVVLIAAGAGIIAVSMLHHDRSEEVSIVRQDGEAPGKTAADERNDNGFVAGKGTAADTARDDASGNTGRGLDLTGGAKLVISDAAFDCIVSNAVNTSIYTHNVNDTVAVLEKSLTRNDILPLALDPPARDAEVAPDPSAKAAPPAGRNVSQGMLNFYYNKKQDPEQVQIVVLATDKVINQVNGDLAKIVRSQLVSQAPESGLLRAKDRSSSKGIARRAGPPRTERQPVDSDGQTLTIAQADRNGTTVGGTTAAKKPGPAAPVRPKAKAPGKGTGGEHGNGYRAKADPSDSTGAAQVNAAGAAVGQQAKVPSVQPAAKPGTAAPDAKRAIESKKQDDSPPVTIAKRAQTDYKGGAAGAKAKQIGGPTTQPGESRKTDALLAEALDANIAAQGAPGRDLASVLSRQIAVEQERGEQDKEIQKNYDKLTKVFRQNILADEVRRNVQSQRAQGVNIQALIININRRDLRRLDPDATKAGIRARGARAYTRPKATTASAPALESTTRQPATQNKSSAK